ncbi:MAG: hypothetical protein ACOC95_10415 [Planctomycetota bacterium]
MTYWFTTRWPTTGRVVSARPVSTLRPPDEPPTPAPGDSVLICGVTIDWQVVRARRPQRGPIAEQWPQPPGTVVEAVVIDPPDDEARRRPLCLGRDPSCWIRLLDLRLPNYDGFDPIDDILRILGMNDANAQRLNRTDLAGLVAVTAEQVNNLQVLFSQRRSPA